MKPIIIYYSRSGNTEKIALKLQKDLSCDVVKIIPEKTYGNYVSSCLRVTYERGAKITPKFVTAIPDTNNFDVIFLGFPIWMQDVPVFVADFITQCDIKDKTIIPFATYGMSDITWTKKTLERICNGANIKLPFDSGVFKKGNYEQWLEKVKELID